jgi:hypothetical protein
MGTTEVDSKQTASGIVTRVHRFVGMECTPIIVQSRCLAGMGNPVEGERDSGLKPNTIPL